MNWAVFALSLGGIYLLAFAWLIQRRGWSTAAFLAGLLHLFFATVNSAAPFRALIDGMYMGWQIGLLRFEGRAAVLPSAIVLVWALVSAWLCAQRPTTRWMRLVTWGDLFWLVNICVAMVLTLSSGGLQKEKIQLGEYFQISGLWVGLFFLIAVPLLLGSSAFWAYRVPLRGGGQRRVGG